MPMPGSSSPMRTPLVVGNWKMNPTSMEAAIELAGGVRAGAEGLTDAIAVVCPPAIWLRAVADSLDGGPVKIGAQTMHAEEGGAFTGEISPLMLAGLAEYVIIGHSERRQLFGETDASVNRKLGAAMASGLVPIVCIGETLEERERNDTLTVLDRQIKNGLDGITGQQVGGLVIAYEPVWAIGTGRTATTTQAQEAHAHIRQRLRQWFGAAAAEECHVIYGGSVKPDNTHDLVGQPDVDGALVGGASLDIKSFFEIIQRARG